MVKNSSDKNYIHEINIDNELLPKIFGSFDVNVKKIEKEFNVSIVIRNEKIKIIGDKSDVITTSELIDILISKANKGNEISEQDLNYCMDTILNKKENNIETKNNIVELDDNVLSRTIQGKP